MARILVTGGGVVGLTTAMLLARDGHEVTVLERDPAEPPSSPDEIWSGWERRGVNQFRMLHFILPRTRIEIEANLPDVAAALDDFGALRISPIAHAPDELTGGHRDEDDDFVSLTARRPVLEAAFAASAAATPGLTIRRGVAVRALRTGDPRADGVPHVIGVETEAGEAIDADIVVDATGRRSNLPARLDAVGARPVDEELDDCGFVYFGRHFRSTDGTTPVNLGALLQHYGSISVLTLPADNDTWACGIVTSSRDPVMRGLRDLERWEALWRSLPLVAHWLTGEPISDGVAVMAKIEDRHRTFVTDGTPVATGVLAVGDAWACTNPSVGRGVSIGLLHALALRDHLRDASPDDPVELARGWHDATLGSVEPWYRATLSYDRHRLAEIDAEVDGTTYESDDPVYAITKALEFAAGSDPEALRAALRVAGMLDLPDDALARPGVFDAVLAVGDAWRGAEVMAPSRQEMVGIVGAGAGA